MVRTPGPNVMTFDEGWEIMEAGISKLKQILEGKLEIQFDSEDYMRLYETIYNMCTQGPRNDYSAQLYERYKGVITDYISSTVLPCLRDTHDEFLLMEFVKRWANHKVMVQWLTRFFHYLNRYYVPRCNKAPLQEVGRLCFVELVYEEVKGRVADAVIRLIDREREGDQEVDRSLLKNVLDIFVEIGVGTDSTSMDFYVNDFEDAMLKDTAECYSRKASIWIVDQVSCPEYMLKAEECLKQEKERAAHYLHSSTEQKLLELVRKQLHSAYEN